MTTPKWPSTALSFVLIALILIAYVVTKPPVKMPSETAPILDGVGEKVFVATPLYMHMLKVGSTEIRVAYASTEAEQEQGLSGTAPLTSEQGMLFMFSEPSVQSFWMKDMNYPIDIIWIDAGKKVIGVSAGADPSSYPQVYSSVLPAQYVLEVASGFAEANGIVPGTGVSF